MSKNNKFCPLPWIHSYIGNSGHFQVCCINDEHDVHNKHDHTGEDIHISDGLPHKEVMNTKYMKEFRLKLLRGEFPAECSRCQLTEELGGTSRRMTEIDQYHHLIDDLIKNTKEDGAINEPIRHVDYRLGNTCNLQCRMCGPNASSKWIKDYEQLPDHLYNYSSRARLDEFRNLKWQNESILLDEFIEKSGKVERLHFAGGEAFFIKGMEEILQKCIESGEAENIILSYNTNLTILPKSLLEKWKKFKEIKLLVSIDGVGTLNDYIRHPSKWSDIDRNLKYLDEQHEKYNISEIMLSTTVQMNNILHLEEIFHYLEQFNFVVPIPNLIMLRLPQYFSLLALPKKLRFMATLKLESLKQKYTKQTSKGYEYLLDNLDTVIKQLGAPPEGHLQKKLFTNFIEFNEIYDTTKQLNLFDINPEFRITNT